MCRGQLRPGSTSCAGRVGQIDDVRPEKPTCWNLYKPDSPKPKAQALIVRGEELTKAILAVRSNFHKYLDYDEYDAVWQFVANNAFSYFNKLLLLRI